MRTIEQLYCDAKTSPEEYFYIVKSCTHKDIDVQLLRKILAEHLDWESVHFPQIHCFSFSIHASDSAIGKLEYTCQAFITVRKTWIAHNKFGDEIVSKRKALLEMGMERPDAGKKATRYNNAELTYIMHCCEHLRHCCIACNLDVSIEVVKKSFWKPLSVNKTRGVNKIIAVKNNRVCDI